MKYNIQVDVDASGIHIRGDVAGLLAALLNPPEAEPQSLFDVVVVRNGRLVPMLKVVRQYRGLSLEKAKDLCETSGPYIVWSGVPIESANAMAHALREVGAEVHISRVL